MINKLIRIVLPALLITGIVIVGAFAYLGLNQINLIKEGMAALSVATNTTTCSAGYVYVRPDSVGKILTPVMINPSAADVAQLCSYDGYSATGAQFTTGCWTSGYALGTSTTTTKASGQVTCHYWTDYYGVAKWNSATNNWVTQSCKVNNKPVADWVDCYMHVASICCVPLPPSITVTAPAANANLVEGNTYPITWTSKGIPATSTVTIKLYASSDNSLVFMLSTNPAISAGQYSWTVPTVENDGITPLPTGQYYVTVSGGAISGGSNGTTGKSGVFNIQNPTVNCYLCLYQDYPECTGLTTTSACAGFLDPNNYTLGCAWDTKNNKCISRWKQYCQDNQVSMGNKCDISSIQADPNKVAPYNNSNLTVKTSLIANFAIQNKCTNLNYFEYEHGSALDCPTLGQTTNACASCISGNCNVYKNSCSTFQNQASVTTMAQNIQNQLCTKGDKTTKITVTATQTVWVPGCQEQETLTITCDKISTNYFNCNAFSKPPLCTYSEERATCSNYSATGGYQGDTQYICCPSPISYTGLADKTWQPTSTGLCPNYTITTGTAEGYGTESPIYNRDGFAAYNKALLTAQAACGKNLFDPGSMKLDNNSRPFYSTYRFWSSWRCFTPK